MLLHGLHLIKPVLDIRSSLTQIFGAQYIEYSELINSGISRCYTTNNFISIALLSYVQGALQSCKQHYWKYYFFHWVRFDNSSLVIRLADEMIGKYGPTGVCGEHTNTQNILKLFISCLNSYQLMNQSIGRPDLENAIGPKSSPSVSEKSSSESVSYSSCGGCALAADTATRQSCTNVTSATCPPSDVA